MVDPLCDACYLVVTVVQLREEVEIAHEDVDLGALVVADVQALEVPQDEDIAVDRLVPAVRDVEALELLEVADVRDVRGVVLAQGEDLESVLVDEEAQGYFLQATVAQGYAHLVLGHGAQFSGQGSYVDLLGLPLLLQHNNRKVQM